MVLFQKGKWFKRVDAFLSVNHSIRHPPEAGIFYVCIHNMTLVDKKEARGGRTCMIRKNVASPTLQHK
jgi:hypothetical protein